MWDTWVRSLGLEDPLEKVTATYSSFLAWKILWTEEPAGYSPWGAKSWTQLSGFHSRIPAIEVSLLTEIRQKDNEEIDFGRKSLKDGRGIFSRFIIC